jgi:hypothetical protein
MTTGNLSYRAGSIDRTRSWAVAEGFGSVTSGPRIPLINNHLHRHLASPNAAGALVLVGSCRQPPMTALPVDGKRRWNVEPRRRLRLFLNLSYGNFQIADLVKFNGLKTRLGKRQRIPGCPVTCPEVVFGVSAFTDTEEKITLLISDPATNPECVTQIRMMTLVERAS